MKVCCKKTCKYGGIPQSLSNFSRDLSRKDKHQRECKSCRKNRYKLNSLKDRNLYLKRTFGISLDTYNQMLQNQNGVCKICERRSGILGTALAVDHCHKTGKIRALLCEDCNVSLGRIREDRQVLFNMIKYIEEFEERINAKTL